MGNPVPCIWIAGYMCSTDPLYACTKGDCPLVTGDSGILLEFDDLGNVINVIDIEDE